MDLNKLKNKLEADLKLLNGDWIKKNSGYDHYISNILNFIDNKGRYWDAIYDDYYIEYKKGNSIWLDLVRYSETILNANEDAKKETVTLFFIPDKLKIKIQEILCVKTSIIIDYLKLDIDVAKDIVDIKEKMPRSLNAQASLTVNDIRQICDFRISL